ncbi:MAG: type II toxin-antitoxin system VapC family toxin [Polynucleobacter sp.]|jgi:predicted nucleic acid-binding protein|uniref:type II toxin-antitoxin system VapC family toxin n=1 Tax=Polynucleobacter sp. TaxID=2029855 RepID=UPI0021744F38|nr:type II toxin-antitoxin system VapC family toxin [Polynucleobacter sp.]MBU3670232.1 type II toxin-antitoxin system VapC family toxin [Polynucleobacter sp.]
MLYIDTSIFVGLCTQEAKSPAIHKWYDSIKDVKLVSSTWAFTEFASALSIKERTGQITPKQSKGAWKIFETFCSNDVELMPIDNKVFYSAGLLVLDSTSKLRSGDALHLAIAKSHKVKCIITLDKVLEKNAKRLKMKVMTI